MYCFTVSNLSHIKGKNSRRILHITIGTLHIHRFW